MIRRRQFMALLAAMAVSWPTGTQAEQRERVWRIGVLVPLPPTVFAPFFSELRQAWSSAPTSSCLTAWGIISAR
jgi:hypothetical protein